jgi:pSer/pThr/pTyr-binding forkhead associated (FHA) protein
MFVNPTSQWYIKDGQWNIKERRWNPSLNGTFINGKKLDPTQRSVLQTGDIITIGDATLKVVLL